MGARRDSRRLVALFVARVFRLVRWALAATAVTA
ncbi:MAG: hypothetical protein QOJ43_2768, partial [Gaiellaceae bacterium]|nr:hypothetical protein [Gaiellaceae bacterium]